MKYGSLSALAGLFLVAGAGSAAASSTTLSYDGWDAQWGIFKSVTLTYGRDRWGNKQQVYADAGAFHMTDQDNNSLITWCLDLFGSLKDDLTYQITDTPFGDNVIETFRLNNIQALFDTSYGSLDLTSSSQSAGFQIALWELLYEDSGTYNVDENSWSKRGNFYVDWGSSSAVAKANEFLSNIAKDIVGEIYDLTYYDAGSSTGRHTYKNYQDLVGGVEIPPSQTPEVPLPATAWLLGGGLAALFGFARRRKAANA